MNTERRMRGGAAIHHSSFAIHHRAFARRGNALIMAVTLTAMLAIIGSTFVLVTRLERQSVRSFGTVQGFEQVQDAVIRTIQSTLAGDVVQQGGTVTVSRLKSTTDGTTVNPNYDPFDAPAAADPWLAAIEPTAHWNITSNTWDRLEWPQGSEIFGYTPGSINLLAVPNGTADADGDGIPDSFWRTPDTLQVIDGKDVRVAVRIIDNCGMLNLNTAFAMAPALTGVSDAYGILPTQVNVRGLLNMGRPLLTPGSTVSAGTIPTPIVAEVWLVLSRLSRTVPQPNYGANIAEWMTNYTNYLLRFYEKPQAYAWYIKLYPPSPLPPSPYPAPYDLGAYARLFDVNDELALRNRFLLKAASTSRVESAEIVSIATPATFAMNGPEGLWNVIGDEPGDLNNDGKYEQRRRPAFSTSPTDLAAWADALFGDQRAAIPYRDIRHLLTTYSFDRTVRPRGDAGLDTESLNPSSPTPLLQGPLRQVDIDRVVTGFLSDTGVTPHLLEVERSRQQLQHAIRHAGYGDGGVPPSSPGAENDEVIQYMANLWDYLDTGDESTYIGQGAFASAGLGMPSRAVFGYERQPFISEVFCRLTQAQDLPAAPDMTISAVELCNPYETPISLEGWKLYQGSAQKVQFNAGVAVPARPLGEMLPGRLVVTTDGSVVDTTSEPQNLTVIADATFKFTVKSSDVLKLTRPGPTGAPLGTEVLVDMVVGSDMAAVTGTTDAPESKAEVKEYSIQRGTSFWRFARNEFAPYKDPISGKMGGTSGTLGLRGLGRWVGKAHQPTSAAPGVALPVANNRATTPLAAATTFKVAGWFEMGRPTLVGNPSVGDYDAHSTDPLYWPITEQIGPRGVARQMMTAADEAKVRFNFADANTNPVQNRARRLFEAMGFFARNDDGYDNETGAAVTTTAENLTECRIPGRINVNTAPEAVLRAVFPLLADPAAQATADDLAIMAEWFAKAVVDLRDRRPVTPGTEYTGPFLGLDDLARRLDMFSNPEDPITGERPIRTISAADSQAQMMRFARMLALVDTYRSQYKDANGAALTSRTQQVRNVGDLFMTGDFEDRDWLFGRMANLLTVRSDTFTAYIVIRIQNPANANDFTERRVMAIFDRSNVFLPPGLARNNANDSQDAGLPDDTRDRLYVTPKVVAIQPVPDVN